MQILYSIKAKLNSYGHCEFSRFLSMDSERESFGHSLEVMNNPWPSLKHNLFL
jgi:hypothetical protein